MRSSLPITPGGICSPWCADEVSKYASLGFSRERAQLCDDPNTCGGCAFCAADDAAAPPAEAAAPPQQAVPVQEAEEPLPSSVQEEEAVVNTTEGNATVASVQEAEAPLQAQQAQQAQQVTPFTVPFESPAPLTADDAPPLTADAADGAVCFPWCDDDLAQVSRFRPPTLIPTVTRPVTLTPTVPWRRA